MRCAEKPRSPRCHWSNRRKCRDLPDSDRVDRHLRLRQSADREAIAC